MQNISSFFRFHDYLTWKRKFSCCCYLVVVVVVVVVVDVFVKVEVPITSAHQHFNNSKYYFGIIRRNIWQILLIKLRLEFGIKMKCFEMFVRLNTESLKEMR